MTFFVDANVLVYAAGAGERHDSCVELLLASGAGQGEGRTSTAVVEEV